MSENVLVFIFECIRDGVAGVLPVVLHSVSHELIFSLIRELGDLSFVIAYHPVMQVFIPQIADRRI